MCVSCYHAQFELSLSDWAVLCATEGVPLAYRVREVPIDEIGPPARPEPVTAESISKIGPLPERRRAFTLFGRSRR